MLNLGFVLMLSLGAMLMLILGPGTVCMWLNLFMAFSLLCRSSPVALWRSNTME
jgi:hypothetical protein